MFKRQDFIFILFLFFLHILLTGHHTGCPVNKICLKKEDSNSIQTNETSSRVQHTMINQIFRLLSYHHYHCTFTGRNFTKGLAKSLGKILYRIFYTYKYLLVEANTCITVISLCTDTAADPENFLRGGARTPLRK